MCSDVAREMVHFFLSYNMPDSISLLDIV